MKVLWLADFPSPFDPNPVVAPWAVNLATMVSRYPGIELTVLNFTYHLPQDIYEYDRDGIHFIFLRVATQRADILSLYQRRIGAMRRYLRQHYRAYDLIHVHGSELQFQVAAAGLDIPQLLSVQGLVSEYAKVVPNLFSKLKFLWKLAGYYESKYMPLMPHFSCRTHWDKSQVARMSPESTIHHNWETIRPEFFAPAATTPNGRPQVLFLGGQQVIKGFNETLAAFDLARQQQPDLKLVMAGRATAADVERAVQQAGLRHIGPEDVECHGFLAAADLTRLCHESMCLLHPSYIDNSPNTVCEAQVAGLPVVASDVGGVSSLITCGETGLLTDLTPRNLANQVLRLHDDPALRQRLARQALAVAQERHNPAAILQKTVDIYHAIL